MATSEGIRVVQNTTGLLEEIARRLILSMQEKIYSNGLPAELADGLVTSPVQFTDTQAYIDIYVTGEMARRDNTGKTTPLAQVALAYEFGSGIHRTSKAPGAKSPGKYIIAPKDASVLAFEWSPQDINQAFNSPKTAGYDPTRNIWFFNYVEHPGVEPRPFMIPALEQNIKFIAETLVAGYTAQFIADAVATTLTFTVK